MCNGSVAVKGATNVVDRLGIGSVPIGIESFVDVISRHVYVDKTAVINDLIDRGGVTLFCRPRRFGKSLMLRMLQCYFEAPVEGWVEDDPTLFDGLAIMGAPERHTSQRGTHPVIYLGLNACGGDTWEAALKGIARAVRAEYARHAYLRDGNALLPYERDYFDRMCGRDADVYDLEESLSWLAGVLRRYHHSQTVILIDEYDKIVTEGHLYEPRGEGALPRRVDRSSECRSWRQGRSRLPAQGAHLRRRGGARVRAGTGSARHRFVSRPAL